MTTDLQKTAHVFEEEGVEWAILEPADGSAIDWNKGFVNVVRADGRDHPARKLEFRDLSVLKERYPSLPVKTVVSMRHGAGVYIVQLEP
jgi:hypothetical protein